MGAALAAAAVSFAGIGSHSFWTPDEPRDAAVGKAMWASGDLVVPRLNGRPFLEKPPLAWWAQAAGYQVLGVSDATARVTPALFGTLTLLVIFALGRRLGGIRAGWLAAGALASTAEFSEDIGRAIVDPALVLLVTLAYAGFVVLVTPRPREAEGGGELPGKRAVLERPGAGAPAGATLLIALAVPLAFLAKGVVGIGLALAPPLLFLLLAAAGAAGRGGAAGLWHGWRGTARLLAPLALLGVPLFAAIVLPWAVALLREGGWAAVRECLVGNTVGRLLSTAAGRAYGHRQPFWYYLPAGAAALLPWTLALPAMLRGGGRVRGGGRGSGSHGLPWGATPAGVSAG
ncbi:MAG TPA: glycosyltransferase family 39 protein, partial [Thermoanaerobaculia bacterium]